MRTFVYSCALAAAMLPSTSAFAAFAPSACRLPVHASQGRSLQVSHAPRSARVGAIALRAAEDDVIRTEAEAPVSPAKAEDGSAAFFEKEFSMDSLEGVGVKDPEVADKALLEKEFEADSALGKDPTPPSPGQLDNSRFRCDASVQKWADFDNFASAEDNFSAAAAIPAKYIGTSPQAAQYWAGHMARTAYFAANALAGTTAFQLSQQASGSEGQPDINGTPWASPNGLGVDMKIASRLVLEAMMCYEQDWLAVERGDIKARASAPPRSRAGPRAPETLTRLGCAGGRWRGTWLSRTTASTTRSTPCGRHAPFMCPVSTGGGTRCVQLVRE